jgi:hypothetical protein
MHQKMTWLMGKLRYKLFHLWLGAALGSGLVILGQGCAASGQCPACGACIARLPILALPLLADSAIVLVGRVHESMLTQRDFHTGVPAAGPKEAESEER